jgi:hypothetical protein
MSLKREELEVEVKEALEFGEIVVRHLPPACLEPIRQKV